MKPSLTMRNKMLQLNRHGWGLGVGLSFVAVVQSKYGKKYNSIVKGRGSLLAFRVDIQQNIYSMTP